MEGTYPITLDGKVVLSCPADGLLCQLANEGMGNSTGDARISNHRSCNPSAAKYMPPALVHVGRAEPSPGLDALTAFWMTEQLAIVGLGSDLAF